MKQKPARLTQKQAFFRKSIGATIMAAFSALILGTVLLMALFSYQFTRDEVQSNAMDYTQQLIMQVNADIDFYVEYIKDIMDIIVRNSSVSSYLIQGRDAPEGVRERVAEQLANAKSIRREISSIALITVDGRAVFSDASFTLNPYSFYENAAWYQDALNSPSEVYISSSHVQNIIEGEYDWVVTFSLAVPGPRGMPAAVLLIDLNYEVINDICARIELGNRGYIFLLDSRGDILWHPAQQLIYSNLKQENVGEVFALGNGRKLIGSG
ncbi:MAG TPA: cache domain-containing protein, partial [Clostridia bacterium]|nr:cache domain-containing protein [Clostridia bacterium]